MKKQNKSSLNISVESFESTETYFENLKINKQGFKALSTHNKRTGNSGKTKPNWRTTDGIKYPVTIYKASELKEDTQDE